jgi:hypothetical protein
MDEIQLIGVDGGATEVKAHAVACDDLARANAFALRPESAARVYPRLPDFTPLPVAEQLAQRDSGKLELSLAEIEQGRLWVAAAAEAIIQTARACAAQRVLVGIGMPGLKTPDRRGIGVINNGPRMPEYLTLLERNLASVGVELAAPIAALGSDADYCGLGEEYAADGLFRDVQNAYYVGGGTGLADALKLRGELLPFDATKSWLLKAWQIPSALGPTFEQLVSASALNRVWARWTDVASAPRGRRSTPETLHTADTAVPPVASYPERAALAGDPRAVAWLDTAALVLAELIFERLWTTRNGCAKAPSRGDAYAKLDPNHDYRGTLLDRVIIGQRIGLIYADPQYRAVFGDKLDTYLAAWIARGGDAEMAAATICPNFMRASKLRAAPALGAAVAAAQACLMSPT